MRLRQLSCADIFAQRGGQPGGRDRTEEVLAVEEQGRKTEAVREGEGERKNIEKEEVPAVSPTPSRYTGEVAFMSVSTPVSPHLPHSDTRQYLRGLGICGHQGNAG